MSAEVRQAYRSAVDVSVMACLLTNRDDPGTGRVQLARQVERGSVPRDDVASVLLALLDAEPQRAVLEVVGGDTPIDEAVRSVLSPGGRG